MTRDKMPIKIRVFVQKSQKINKKLTKMRCFMKGRNWAFVIYPESMPSNWYELLEQTIKFNEPINISTKHGNAVVLSEEDYNNLMETLYISSIPFWASLKSIVVNNPISDKYNLKQFISFVCANETLGLSTL